MVTCVPMVHVSSFVCVRVFWCSGFSVSPGPDSGVPAVGIRLKHNHTPAAVQPHLRSFLATWLSSVDAVSL